MMNDTTSAYSGSDERKRLFRSRTNRVIGGVCGGIGDYFNIDPVIVRVVTALSALFGGLGLVIYIAGLILIPENPNESYSPGTQKRQYNNSSIIWGIVLIVIGILFLSDNFDFWMPHLYYFHWPRFLHWPHFLNWNLLFPIAIIIGGALFLVHALKKEPSAEDTAGTESRQSRFGSKTFYKISAEKKVAGVCAGIADYLNIDVPFVRLGWVVLTIYTHLFGLLAYIVLAVIAQEKPLGGVSDQQNAPQPPPDPTPPVDIQ